MRRFILLAAMMLSLTTQARAFSFNSGTFNSDPPYWLDLYAGTVGPLSAPSLYLQIYFNSTQGPILPGSYSGPISQTQQAGFASQGVVRTIIGFDGSGDHPIFSYSPGPGTFAFNPTFATLNPTLGSISGLLTGFSSTNGSQTLSFQQNGPNITGIYSDARQTLPFTIFEVDYTSPQLSAVPLPPALPMFAVALLALCAVGYFKRGKRPEQVAIA